MGKLYFLSAKEWFTDLFSLMIHPNKSTFIVIHEHSRKKLIVSFLMVAAGFVFQYLVSTRIIPIDSSGIVIALSIFIFRPVYLLLILGIFYFVIRKGYNYTEIDFVHIFYPSSLIFYIIIILSTGVVIFFPNYLGSFHVDSIDSIVITFFFLLCSVAALLYAMSIIIIWIRAIFPERVQRYFKISILWGIILFLCGGSIRWVTSISTHILPTHEWYWIYLIPLLSYGIVLAIAQSWAIRGTSLSIKLWFCSVIIGAFMGSIIYISIQALSISRLFNITINNPLVDLMEKFFNNNNPTNLSLSIYSLFWDAIPKLAFTFSLASSQWIVLRKTTRYSLFWIVVSIISEILILISNDHWIVGLLCGMLSGIILTVFLSNSERR
jgi:hypothetical protein